MYVKVKEAAEALNISRETIYKLIQNGKLSYKTNSLNTVKRIDLNELKSLFEVQK